MEKFRGASKEHIWICNGVARVYTEYEEWLLQLDSTRHILRLKVITARTTLHMGSVKCQKHELECL